MEEPATATATASAESQREANSPSGNESQNGEIAGGANLRDRVLANNIGFMLESSEPPLSHKCCIYRVPHDIRKLNEEAYTPHYISIGPFHHGNKRLETMEKLKVRYLKRFLQNTALNMENLVSFIRSKKDPVRCCYEETIQLNNDNFVKMILLDASFIIVFFLERFYPQWRGDGAKLFTQRLISSVSYDIQLLENQLPFFVIKELHNLAFSLPSYDSSFIKLTSRCSKTVIVPKRYPIPNLEILEILHFVDFLRTSLVAQSDWPRQRNRGDNVRLMYTASQLHEVGVKFKVVSTPSKCLFDLKFSNEVLEIPCLEVHDTIELFFRNLMALEQCHYLFDAYVTEYIFILDLLINTDKDVDLLVQNKILVNGLGDTSAVVTLVNKLCTNIVYVGMNDDYIRLCDELNAFYKNCWHTWKTALRREYFSNPWRIASTIIAIILLILTFIQTVRSFY